VADDRDRDWRSSAWVKPWSKLITITALSTETLSLDSFTINEGSGPSSSEGPRTRRMVRRRHLPQESAPARRQQPGSLPLNQHYHNRIIVSALKFSLSSKAPKFAE
jgi:hypothetical protein